MSERNTDLLTMDRAALVAWIEGKFGKPVGHISTVMVMECVRDTLLASRPDERAVRERADIAQAWRDESARKDSHSIGWERMDNGHGRCYVIGDADKTHALYSRLRDVQPTPKPKPDVPPCPLSGGREVRLTWTEVRWHVWVCSDETGKILGGTSSGLSTFSAHANGKQLGEYLSEAQAKAAVECTLADWLDSLPDAERA